MVECGSSLLTVFSPVPVDSRLYSPCCYRCSAAASLYAILKTVWTSEMSSLSGSRVKMTSVMISTDSGWSSTLRVMFCWSKSKLVLAASAVAAASMFVLRRQSSSDLSRGMWRRRSSVKMSVKSTSSAGSLFCFSAFLCGRWFHEQPVFSVQTWFYGWL